MKQIKPLFKDFKDFNKQNTKHSSNLTQEESYYRPFEVVMKLEY